MSPGMSESIAQLRRIEARQTSPSVLTVGLLCGLGVARELSVIVASRVKPGMAVSDNGTELTSNAIPS